MVGLLWTLLSLVGANDEAVVSFRGGARESVQISEANKNKKVIKTDHLKTLTEKVNKVVVNIKKFN